jgi:hypothetical protein
MASPLSFLVQFSQLFVAAPMVVRPRRTHRQGFPIRCANLYGRFNAIQCDPTRSPRTVISVSFGAIGGLGANHHLRQCPAYLNVFTMAQLQAYLGGANLFDEQARSANAIMRDLSAGFVRALAG